MALGELMLLLKVVMYGDEDGFEDDASVSSSESVWISGRVMVSPGG